VDRNLYLLKDVDSVVDGAGQQTAGFIKKTFQLIGSTDSGVGSTTVDVEFSNDPLQEMWLLGGTITLTLGTTKTTDGFFTQANWSFVRGKVTTLTGTGARVTLLMAT
jgi:hypothetical protein